MDNKLRLKPLLYLCLIILLSIFCTCNTSKNETVVRQRNTEKCNSKLKNVKEIIFVKDDEWIAFDEMGGIWKTFDRGKMWHKYKTIPSNSSRYAISFINQKVGYYLVDEKLWRTVDGGKVWKIVRDFSKSTKKFNYLFEVYFSDEENGWIAGTFTSSNNISEGRILITIDGGSTWKETIIHGTDILSKKTANRWYVEDIFFLDNKYGWAVGYGNALKTTDGGNNWFAVDELQGIFKNIKFSDNNNGLAKEKELTASRFTTDGGETWKNITFPTQLRNYELFLTKSNDYILMNTKGDILIADSDIKWKRPEIIPERWKSLTTSNTFGNVYIGYAFDKTLVVVMINKVNSCFHSMYSSDHGVTWY